MQARLDRAERGGGRLGDFRQAEAVHEPEQQCFAMFLRQAGENCGEVGEVGAGTGCVGSGELIQRGGVVSLGASRFAPCRDRKVSWRTSSAASLSPVKRTARPATQSR